MSSLSTLRLRLSKIGRTFRRNPLAWPSGNRVKPHTIWHGVIRPRTTAAQSTGLQLFKVSGPPSFPFFFTTATLIRRLQKHTWELSPELGTQYTIRCRSCSLQIRIPKVYLSSPLPDIG